MHLSSIDNLRTCLKRHVLNDPVLSEREPLRVLDVCATGTDSFCDVFRGLGVDYVRLDLDDGHDGRLTPTSAGSFPLDDESFDLVITGSTLEHTAAFWTAFQEMVRVCRIDGVLVVIAPSAGPAQRSPRDCYRFLPDAMNALAQLSNVTLVDSWRDRRGPFHDLVGVFRREPLPSAPAATEARRRLVEELHNDERYADTADIPKAEGVATSWDVLSRVHAEFQPRFYLEIGVFEGASLRLAECPAIGVDPKPQLLAPLADHHLLVEMTSDDFFEQPDVDARCRPLDLAYIDGLHLSEYVLKDFMHVERLCHPASAVLIDDILPVRPIHAERHRRSQFWTGDVWKIVPVLRRARPDLLLLPIDTWPGGTLIVAGLDPENDDLWEQFDELTDWMIGEDEAVPDDVLARAGTFAPDDPLIIKVLRRLRRARELTDPAPEIARIRDFVAGSLPREVAPT